MHDMEKYLTEQRKALLTFLQAHPDETFSVSKLSKRLQGSDISVSAVYRNIGKLVETGLVERSIRNGSREMQYQFVGHKECSQCIHLTCVKCGRICHMDQSNAQQMVSNLLQTDEFLVDKKKTVLYGICKACR